MDRNADRDNNDTGRPDAYQPDAHHPDAYPHHAYQSDGYQPDAYWRRRVITLCAGLALLGLLAWAFSASGGKPAAAKKAAQTSGALPAAYSGTPASGTPAPRPPRHVPGAGPGRQRGQPRPHLQAGPLGLGAQDGGERLADVLHLLHLHQVGKAVGALQGRS